MRSSPIVQASGFTDGSGVVLFNGNSILKDPTASMVAVEMPRRSRGRAILRVHSTVDQTLGDGTFAHAFVLVAQRAAGVVENLGFVGINIGGIAPQLPLLALRDWSQIIEDLDGYTKFCVSGFAGNEATAGVVTITLTPLAE